MYIFPLKSQLLNIYQTRYSTKVSCDWQWGDGVQHRCGPGASALALNSV